MFGTNKRRHVMSREAEVLGKTWQGPNNWVIQLGIRDWDGATVSLTLGDITDKAAYKLVVGDTYELVGTLELRKGAGKS